MIISHNKKSLDKLYDNKEFDKLLELYKECSSEEDSNALRLFFYRKNDDLSETAKKNLFINIVLKAIRKYNLQKGLEEFKASKIKNSRKTDALTSEENEFIKMFKKQLIDYTLSYKDKISKETYVILKQIYNTNKDYFYTSIFNVNMLVDLYFEDGICFGNSAFFNDNIKVINNFDYMLKYISCMEDEVSTKGCLLIKVPKNAINRKSEPIYYIEDNSIYLNPKYIICYIPVVDKKILGIEFNDEAREVVSTIYEGESIDPIMRKK